MGTPANSGFFASRANVTNLTPAPNTPKSTRERADSSDDLSPATFRKKTKLKLKEPKVFSGEGDDNIALKEDFKRFKRDVRNNLEGKRMNKDEKIK